MKTFKLFVRGSTKVVGGIAVLVFVRAPFTNTGLGLMAGAIVVGLASGAGYLWAEPDDDEPENPN
ncbi:MAG: hypothetical protein ACJ71Q_17930 [Terriglobales bacterium]